MYKVLRAKAAWAVLSFRVVAPDDAGLVAAENATGIRLAGARRYFFGIYRWGAEIPDPNDMRKVFVEIIEEATVYVAAGTTLLRRGNGPWTTDRSMPT